MTAPTGVVLVRLPWGIGVEPDPDRPTAGVLVAESIDDLHRLRLELELALGPLTQPTTPQARALLPPSPLEAGTGICPVPGCSSVGGHTHPAGDLRSGSSLPPQSLAGESVSSTAHWPSARWITWLTSHGVGQIEALDQVRVSAVLRGEDPPQSLSAAASRPAMRRDLIGLVDARIDAARRATEPWS